MTTALGNSITALYSAKTNSKNKKTQRDSKNEAIKNPPAPLAHSLCNAFPNFANSLFPVLFFELLTIDYDEEIITENKGDDWHLAFQVLHLNYGLPKLTASNKIENTLSLSFRLYHLLILALLFAFMKWFFKLVPLLPYRKTVLEIEQLLDSLTSRTTLKQENKSWQPLRSIKALYADEQLKSVETDQQDPRSVELALFRILENVRQTEIQLFGFSGLTLPVPEVTFVFDELDKISGVPASQSEQSSRLEDRHFSQNERQRAYALNRLISDMKRVISSAPARFIFVGNRLMHDEWSADQGRRVPLLTSVFDAEVYLPNLMVDLSGPTNPAQEKKGFDRLTRKYVFRRYQSATETYDDFRDKRVIDFFSLEKDAKPSPAYPDDILDKSLQEEIEITLLEKLKYHKGEPVDDKEKEEFLSSKKEFFHQFVRFLTYRSGGNPKKLEELFNSFARPAARHSLTKEITKTPREIESHQCDDVLVFHWHDVYRIQFIDSLYQHLSTRFENRLLERDDKLVEAMLYLLDFILKFHGRAFSWSNLEQVEDLGHIHRIPDLRSIIADTVEESSEKWLHRLLNGMYSFRFRSDMAVELRFLSQLSQQEEASLNFTLDEAQGLKASYLETLETSSKNATRNDMETIAGLAELHEYDQEFVEARSRYESAITILDEKFEKMLGAQVAPEDPIRQKSIEAIQNKYYRDRISFAQQVYPPALISPLRGIMTRDKNALELLTAYLPWGIKRLRLMLQVAMTLELSRDYEGAKAHYLNARIFAWALSEIQYSQNTDTKLSQDSRFSINKDLIKHTNLLFQPLFAEAWISEKLAGGSRHGWLSCGVWPASHQKVVFLF